MPQQVTLAKLMSKRLSRAFAPNDSPRNSVSLDDTPCDLQR